MSNSNADIILAGAAAAFTVDLLVYPLDTIKTRYQSQDYLQTFQSSSSSSKASSTAAGITKPSRTAAFRGLYQGVGSVIIATLPAAGTFFTTYEAAKPLYETLLNNHVPFIPSGSVPTPVIHSLASGTAELASCLVLTPAEVIKQNAQMIRAQPSSSSSAAAAASSAASSSSSTTTTFQSRWERSTSVQALRMMSQNRGAAGVAHRLLTGYTALAARNLPFTALQFPMFEAVRRRLWEWRDDKNNNNKRRQQKEDSWASMATTTVQDGAGGVGGGERRVQGGAVALTKGLFETGWVNGFAAAVSGAVAAVVTTPTDVVKTRMMLFAGGEEENGGSKDGPRKGKGTADKAQAQASTGQNKNKKKKMGSLQMARLVYQERGIQGLFRGALLRAVWTAVGSGLYLGTYEVAKVYLKGAASEDEGL